MMALGYDSHLLHLEYPASDPPRYINLSPVHGCLRRLVAIHVNVHLKAKL